MNLIIMSGTVFKTTKRAQPPNLVLVSFYKKENDKKNFYVGSIFEDAYTPKLEKGDYCMFIGKLRSYKDKNDKTQYIIGIKKVMVLNNINNRFYKNKENDTTQTNDIDTAEQQNYNTDEFGIVDDNIKYSEENQEKNIEDVF